MARFSLLVAAAALATVAAAPATLLAATARVRSARHARLAEAASSAPAPPDRWFAGQVLDHFDTTGDSLGATWAQRYWINDSFFNASGGASAGAPVFLLLEGEGTGSP
jgi:hypothetical protein